MQQAGSDAKAKLEAKVGAARAKLRTTKERADAQLDAARAETDAKVAVLEAKAAHAHERRKQKLEAQAAKLRADFAARSEKLKAAAKLAGQALS